MEQMGFLLCVILLVFASLVSARRIPNDAGAIFWTGYDDLQVSGAVAARAEEKHMPTSSNLLSHESGMSLDLLSADSLVDDGDLQGEIRPFFSKNDVPSGQDAIHDGIPWADLPFGVSLIDDGDVGAPTQAQPAPQDVVPNGPNPLHNHGDPSY